MDYEDRPRVVLRYLATTQRRQRESGYWSKAKFKQRWRVATLVLASVGILVGCISSETTDGVTSSSSSSSTSKTDERPELCRPANVQRSVDRLVNALNTTDLAAADAAVASEPRFQWFSADPERIGVNESADRSTLRQFFADQTAAGYECQVVSLEVNFYRSTDRTGNFEFQLSDRGGKGAIDCDTGLITVCCWRTFVERLAW